MNHDELLAKLNEYQPIIREELFDKDIFGKWRLALRAAVELHKPELPSYCSDDTRCCDEECVICGESYPCKTMEAIEKGLG